MFENKNQFLYVENESFSMESSTKPHNQIIANESQVSGSFFLLHNSIEFAKMQTELNLKFI